jgi:hypothetical protein
MLELNQFTGSSEFFKFNAFSKSIATEGIMHLCQKGNCSWLITDIDAHLIAGNKNKLMQAESMLVAIIKQDETTISKNSSEKGATLRISDGNGNHFVSQYYGYADLPKFMLTIWMVKNELNSFTYMLPSEY